ncbi:HlyD family secretion protein [Acinetobacter sp. DSM 11652]|uniref:HlyD family secretion protein n=1 Tax=Acinetobacter sp. DSM 11652 TaxID=346222 RepID=UPI0008B20691|nr:HlyD family efflux transporter periplasmic adaptor subunit [Acinetobacter sp. DSM 11652]SEL85334.1 membrane fusion protein [Acinetobacter sp. DSM 11652]
MTNKLFRDKAIDAQKSKWIGEVILIRPFSFTVLTIVVAIFTVLLVSFIFFGSYTKRTSVKGLLIPNTGLIRVYSAEGGTVSEKFVKEGQLVEKGTPLITLKMTRYNSTGNYNESVQQQIELKKQSLDTEKNKLKDLHLNNVQQLNAEIQSIRLDLIKLDGLIAEQRQRLALAQENAHRYRDLKDKEYISIEEYQLKQDNYISLKVALQSYEREKNTKQAELENKLLAQQGLASKLESELTLVDRQLASNQQEFLENKARDSLLLQANATGKIASINAEVGQFISPNIPVMNIVPTPSYLEAHLFVSSSAIGFIRTGQTVKLRFQAYPYQKFGQGEGVIHSISATTMNPQELTNLGELSQGVTFNQSEPVYLVKVKLEQQFVKAYGESKPLKVGMAFDADIMQEKRKLYEWVLEPLYSITGKI